MKRKTWVVGALLVAMAGLSSCASTERLIYGNSDNSREDIVRADRSSSQNSRDSRNRTYGDDEGGSLAAGTETEIGMMTAQAGITRAKIARTGTLISRRTTE